MSKNIQAEDLGQEIIENDIDCDIETVGLILGATKKIYVDKNNKPVFNVKEYELIRDKQGEEKIEKTSFR